MIKLFIILNNGLSWNVICILDGLGKYKDLLSIKSKLIYIIWQS